MKALQALLSLLVLVFAVGCGGGGGGTSASDFSVFLTDDMNAGYDHVWVTVYKVEMKKLDGTLVTVSNDAAGRTVDLRALNSSGNPLYLLFGTKAIPNDTYTGVQLTLDKDLVAFTTGATTGTALQFADTYDAAAGQSRFALAFGTPKVVPGADNAIVDFDLANWTVAGSVVTVAVTEGAGTGFSDNARQWQETYRGTVSGLSGTAPNFNFRLTTQAGCTFRVRTGETTAFFGRNGNSPALANNAVVTVRGAYSQADGALRARYVRMNGEGSSDDPMICGLPSNALVDAGTFDVTLGAAKGFVPTANPVHVVVNLGTKFFSENCVRYVDKYEFFAAMAASPTFKTEVEGTYDAGTNTLTATVAKLHDPDGEAGGVAEVEGTVATSPGIDATAGTFTLSATDWSGVILTAGTSVNVVTTGTTVYKVGSIVSDKATFFATISVGTTDVKAVGAYDSTTHTLTAKTLAVGGYHISIE